MKPTGKTRDSGKWGSSKGGGIAGLRLRHPQFGNKPICKLVI